MARIVLSFSRPVSDRWRSTTASSKPRCRLRARAAGLAAAAARIVVVALLLFAGTQPVILVRFLRQHQPWCSATVPQQLGDRLITAVELADPESAERRLFAADARGNLREAASRVDRLPLKDVFDGGLWAWVARLSATVESSSFGGDLLRYYKMGMVEYLRAFRISRRSVRAKRSPWEYDLAATGSSGNSGSTGRIAHRP